MSRVSATDAATAKNGVFGFGTGCLGGREEKINAHDKGEERRAGVSGSRHVNLFSVEICEAIEEGFFGDLFRCGDWIRRCGGWRMAAFKESVVAASISVNSHRK